MLEQPAERELRSSPEKVDRGEIELIPLSFYKGLLDYGASKVNSSYQADHFMYTPEKKIALSRSIRNHNEQIKDTLRKCTDVRHVLETKLTLDNIKTLDSLGEIKMFLGRLQQLNESFLDELGEPITQFD